MLVRLIFAQIIGPCLLILLLPLVQCRGPESTPLWPDKEIDGSSHAANALVQRMNQVTASHGPFRLSTTDEELTSLARVYLPDTHIDDPTILITTQGLYAKATVRLRDPYTIRMLIATHVRNGAPSTTILRAAVNDRDVPRALLWSMDQVTQAILADMEWPVQIEQIALAEGHLTIQGTPRMTDTR